MREQNDPEAAEYPQHRANPLVGSMFDRGIVVGQLAPPASEEHQRSDEVPEQDQRRDDERGICRDGLRQFVRKNCTLLRPAKHLEGHQKCHDQHEWQGVEQCLGPAWGCVPCHAADVGE